MKAKFPEARTTYTAINADVLWRGDSSVGITAGYGLNDREFGVLVPVG
jgi:hypothetical protein